MTPFAYTQPQMRIMRALGDAGCFNMRTGRTIAHSDQAKALMRDGLVESRTGRAAGRGKGIETIYWLSAKGETMFLALVAASNRKCRHCACTEANACLTAAGPCHWVGPECCSNPACIEAEKKLVGHAAD